MKIKKDIIAILVVAAFAIGLISSCAGDPRKNCNHPQHGQYMKEQRMKKHGF
jgi:hypothetical protein